MAYDITRPARSAYAAKTAHWKIHTFRKARGGYVLTFGATPDNCAEYATKNGVWYMRDVDGKFNQCAKPSTPNFWTQYNAKIAELVGAKPASSIYNGRPVYSMAHRNRLQRDAIHMTDR